MKFLSSVLFALILSSGSVRASVVGSQWENLQNKAQLQSFNSAMKPPQPRIPGQSNYARQPLSVPVNQPQPYQQLPLSPPAYRYSPSPQGYPVPGPRPQPVAPVVPQLQVAPPSTQTVTKITFTTAPAPQTYVRVPASYAAQLLQGKSQAPGSASQSPGTASQTPSQSPSLPAQSLSESLWKPLQNQPLGSQASNPQTIGATESNNYHSKPAKQEPTQHARVPERTGTSSYSVQPKPETLPTQKQQQLYPAPIPPTKTSYQYSSVQSNKTNITQQPASSLPSTPKRFGYPAPSTAANSPVPAPSRSKYVFPPTRYTIPTTPPQYATQPTSKFTSSQLRHSSTYSAPQSEPAASSSAPYSPPDSDSVASQPPDVLAPEQSSYYSSPPNPPTNAAPQSDSYESPAAHLSEPEPTAAYSAQTYGTPAAESLTEATPSRSKYVFPPTRYTIQFNAPHYAAPPPAYHSAPYSQQPASEPATASSGSDASPPPDALAPQQSSYTAPPANPPTSASPQTDSYESPAAPPSEPEPTAAYYAPQPPSTYSASPPATFAAPQSTSYSLSAPSYAPPAAQSPTEIPVRSRSKYVFPHTRFTISSTAPQYAAQPADALAPEQSSYTAPPANPPTNAAPQSDSYESPAAPQSEPEPPATYSVEAQYLASPPTAFAPPKSTSYSISAPGYAPPAAKSPTKFAAPAKSTSHISVHRTPQPESPANSPPVSPPESNPPAPAYGYGINPFNGGSNSPVPSSYGGQYGSETPYGSQGVGSDRPGDGQSYGSPQSYGQLPPSSPPSYDDHAASPEGGAPSLPPSYGGPPSRGSEGQPETEAETAAAAPSAPTSSPDSQPDSAGLSSYDSYIPSHPSPQPSRLPPLAPMDAQSYSVAPSSSYYSGSGGYSDDASQAQILRFHQTTNGAGQDSHEFDTSNGIRVKEQTDLEENIYGHGSQRTLVKKGSFSWDAPDGKRYEVRYVADAMGFHPEADHLPKPTIPPPTPQQSYPSTSALPYYSSLQDDSPYPVQKIRKRSPPSKSINSPPNKSSENKTLGMENKPLESKSPENKSPEIKVSPNKTLRTRLSQTNPTAITPKKSLKL